MCLFFLLQVFVDNYLDGGYHVPVAHKDLSSNLNLDKYVRQDYESFHLQACPSDSNQGSVDNHRITGGQSGSSALYLFQYPNVMINRYGQWMDTNIIYPISTDRCVVHFDWFVHPSLLNEENKISLDRSIEQSDKVQQEDIWLCQRVQKGLKSRGYEVGRYAPIFEGMFCLLPSCLFLVLVLFLGGEYLFHSKLHEDFKKSSLHL
jgi:choline monooxygenase